MKPFSLHETHLRKGLGLSAFVFIITLAACKKDGLLVPEYNTSRFDIGDTVVSVTTITTPGDSVVTYSHFLSPVSAHPLGVLEDETYGKVSSEIYTRMFMSTTDLSFPNAVQGVDSVVFFLAYKDFYGFSADLTVSVHELLEAFEEEKTYYSHETMDYESTALGTATLSTNAADTITDSTRVLRIKMSNDLGTDIFNEGGFVDMTAWLKYFNGFCIRAERQNTSLPGGALAYMLLANSESKLVLYYHDVNNKVYGYSFYPYTGYDDGLRFAHFSQEPSTFMENHINQLSNVEYNYVATMAGPRTHIVIDNMEALTNLRPLAINKAELVIPFETPEIDEYLPPERLYLIRKDESGEFQNLIDYSASNPALFGGYLDPVKQEYRFYITSTVSEIINKGQTDLNMYLTVAGSSTSANRVKINGGKHPDRKMKLIITYTKQL